MHEYETTLKQHLRDAQAQLETIISDARGKKGATRREVRQALQGVEAQWKRSCPAPAAVQKKPIEGLKPGQRIKLSLVNQEGIVIKVEQASRKAEILVGDRRIKTGFDAIEYVAGSEEAKAPSISPQHTTTADSFATSLSADDVMRSINVIGMTVDEALPIVDRAIDHAILRGLDTIEIIHGLGTGRLKEAIRAHLKKETLYVSCRVYDDQSPGSAGITRVEIQYKPGGSAGRRNHCIPGG